MTEANELREKIQALVYAELDNALAYTNGGAPSREKTNELEADLAAAKAGLEASLIALLNELSLLRSENEGMRKALEEVRDCLDGEPDYHHQGMGCGLEDRNITDRYQAMEHGWECAMERVYSEHINGAREAIAAALSSDGQP